MAHRLARSVLRRRSFEHCAMQSRLAVSERRSIAEKYTVIPSRVSSASGAGFLARFFGYFFTRYAIAS